MSKRKPLTLTLTLTLDHRDQQRMLQNSIERVLNNAKHTAMALETGKRDEGTIEHASILQEDIEELMPLVRTLWAEVQETLRKELYKVTP